MVRRYEEGRKHQSGGWWGQHVLKVAYINLLANLTYCTLMKLLCPEIYKTMEMSFVVVCGKMGQEEGMGEECVNCLVR